jgi:hypothetical protein
LRLSGHPFDDATSGAGSSSTRPAPVDDAILRRLFEINQARPGRTSAAAA